ncbi:hypothetical protein HPB49_008961 [Dermacentor silvarum]|uniref:Uncharacterized protein n=1 Tax=Dermacentor silvarum TaxID=543639 RepID=A0ACB8D415_DERSI|nr:hypothetical protein HPB49_008961 [Dermacentor silvarum]
MDPWGVLLSRALKALHAQGVGRSAGSSVALFLVSAPRALHPRALLSPALLALDAAAPELLRALFVVTFVSTDTSYAKLWKDRRTQQLYRQLAARTSASEVYAAFRYFNAVSLLITALWRSSKSKPSNGAAALPAGSFFINGTFPSLPTSPSYADARGQVQSKAVLLDYSPGARGFVSVRETEFRDAAQPLRSGAYQVSDRGSSRSWIGRVDWPGGHRLEPDPECVLKEVNCGGAWDTTGVEVYHYSSRSPPRPQRNHYAESRYGHRFSYPRQPAATHQEPQEDAFVPQRRDNAFQ